VALRRLGRVPWSGARRQRIVCDRARRSGSRDLLVFRALAGARVGWHPSVRVLRVAALLLSGRRRAAHGLASGGWMTVPPRHERTMRRATGLLIGMLLGFLSCVVAGWATRDTNVYAGFVRFHTYINFLTLYFPTASEVRAVVRARCRPDRV